MPVFHFTYHAYRSWNADREEGWYQHGEAGRQRPQPALAAHRDHIAGQDGMIFRDDHYGVLLSLVQDICSRRNWRLHGSGMDCTHVHVVVSWEAGFEADEVKDRLKNLLSLLLNRHDGAVGRRVFSKKSGDARVYGRKHLAYLEKEYLPKHPFFWWEKK